MDRLTIDTLQYIGLDDDDIEYLDKLVHKVQCEGELVKNLSLDEIKMITADSCFLPFEAIQMFVALIVEGNKEQFHTSEEEIL